ncbi:MAG TPA: hypothetical protein VLG14_11615 [Sphingomonas sp.]|jgi:hypothetical protein|nr:hypothetical protein [Sphingomonas sp.]
MSNFSNDTGTQGRISRRGFIGTAGIASVAMGGMTTQALAAVGGAKVKTYKGKYAVDGHRVVNGFMAVPRGKTNLDVVLLVSESGKLDAAAETAARNYAASGWIAFAPDLPSTYDTSDKAAMVEALSRDVPRFKRIGHGSGKVAIVTV